MYRKNLSELFIPFQSLILTKKRLLRVTPRKKLGRIGSFLFFLKACHYFKEHFSTVSHQYYVFHLKAMQFIEVFGATSLYDFWTFSRDLFSKCQNKDRS